MSHKIARLSRDISSSVVNAQVPLAYELLVKFSPNDLDELNGLLFFVNFLCYYVQQRSTAEMVQVLTLLVWTTPEDY